jgi:hypothetical protein
LRVYAKAFFDSCCLQSCIIDEVGPVQPVSFDERRLSDCKVNVSKLFFGLALSPKVQRLENASQRALSALHKTGPSLLTLLCSPFCTQT